MTITVQRSLSAAWTFSTNLGLLGVTLVPSDDAIRIYQDQIATHVMEIEENGNS